MNWVTNDYKVAEKVRRGSDKCPRFGRLYPSLSDIDSATHL